MSDNISPASDSPPGIGETRAAIAEFQNMLVEQEGGSAPSADDAPAIDARAAANELRDRRAADAGGITVRSTGENKPRTIREAAGDLALLRRVEEARSLTGLGVSPEEASQVAARGDDGPTKVSYELEGGAVPKDLTARQAAADLSDYRKRAEAQKGALLAELVGNAEQAQQPQADSSAAQEQSTEQSPPEQPAADPREVELAAIRQARALFEHNAEAAQRFGINAVSNEIEGVKSEADLQALLQKDPGLAARMQKNWQTAQQAHQALLASQQQRAAEEQARRSHEHAQREQWAQAEDKKFEQIAPEFADPQQMRQLQDAAVKTLNGAGFSDDQLKRAWTGLDKIDIRHAGVQSIIHKAAQWDAAQERVRAAVAATPVPPVMRPGTRQHNAHGASEHTARDRLRATGKVRDAVAFYKARSSGR